MIILKEKHGCKRLTIQSGETLNGLFLRNKLIDYVGIVAAPVLIDGKGTTILIDGDSITTTDSLGVLKLEEYTILKHSYIRLKYKVIV